MKIIYCWRRKIQCVYIMVIRQRYNVFTSWLLLLPIDSDFTVSWIVVMILSILSMKIFKKTSQMALSEGSFGN